MHSQPGSWWDQGGVQRVVGGGVGAGNEDEWRRSYIPVAREFSVWIIGVSNVGWITGGPWQGRKTIGCSLVIGPRGEEVLQGPYGVDAEAILKVQVTPVPCPARRP